MLGCIPSPKFRVIHRSLLFDAIEEHKQTPPREEQEKEPLLRQILDALEAKEEKTQIEESSKNIVDENTEEKDGNDTSENQVDENKVGNNEENKEEKNEEQEESFAKESEKISKVVAVLEKIEQVHREQGDDLLKANKDLKDSGVAKVSKMEDKIRKVKDNLGKEKKGADLQLLDQPNAAGTTAMHLTTRMDDDEATRMLLDHGANPNVQDSEGNSPLHTICSQRDIQTS